MAVFRVEKNSGYTVMSNHHLRNRALSLKAKGLLSQMLSLPEDWDYTLQGLARINRESIDAIRQAIRELEQAGYIQRSRERDEKGRLRGADYVIFELPQPVPASVSPTLENPTLENPTQENPMPILSDLHQALLDQHLPEADRVAQALDLYVSGSLNVFNHKTNVDIHNRLVAFDIKELGKQLKKLGMLIIQDQIWGRVTQNRSQGRATWYFADEFHLLLKEEQTAAYSAEIWKRFRKWGGVPTGATQNVKDLLSSPEIENILENSDFITLLNQASGDRKILSERLNLSADQQKYIDNSEPGEGLLIFENVVLPFSNPIPKNTQLYKIMTTRLNEVVEL